MDRNRGFREKFAPVKVGDEIDVKIEAVGEKGDGIAKKEGFVLFVPNTKEGQEVRIKVTRVLRNVGFAEVVGEAGSSSEQSEESDSEEREEGTSDMPAENKSEESESQEEDTEDFGEEMEEDKQ
ncbi:TRAM domain-containing protein [Candidatus Woesearchaeota archaeon]|nr:TRAM domain-containing protein [Candidatus Woesearchaeota archaeon]